MQLGNGVVQENPSVESNGAGRGLLHKLPGGRMGKERCPSLINFPPLYHSYMGFRLGNGVEEESPGQLFYFQVKRQIEKMQIAKSNSLSV